MNNVLEFSLEVERKYKDIIIYKVVRKGLPVGMVMLEEPYTRKEAIKEYMEMK